MPFFILFIKVIGKVLLGCFNLLASLIVIVKGDICGSDKFELHYSKRTGNTQNQEIFFLHDIKSLNLLFTSPIPPSSTVKSYTACIPKTEDDAYYLVYSDTEWDDDSSVTFYSPFGTVSYSGHYETDKVILILNTPILKDSDWYVLRNREIYWTDISWENDSSPRKKASEVASYVNGNHIFVRKVFDAPKTTPTAYEIHVLYKHGVVVYVNGYEVFRDNLPVETISGGVIHANIVNSKGYSTYDYRGVVRNAFELGSNKVFVAIEIHANEVVTKFDAWLSIYGSSWPYLSGKNYMYPVTSAVSMGNKSYSTLCDHNYNSTFYIPQYSEYYLDFQINGQCNGLFYYVKAPYGKIKHLRMWDNDGFASIINQYINIDYDSPTIFRGSSYLSSFKSIRVVVKDVTAIPSGITEMRPVILYGEFHCQKPDVEDKTYEYKAGDTILEILLPMDVFYSCDSMQSLPEGLTISETCVLSGKTMDVGIHILPITVFVSNCNVHYFTVTLTILDSNKNTLYYDTSYQMVPIIITVIICLVILLLALLSIWLVSRSHVKPKQLKKVTPNSALFPVFL